MSARAFEAARRCVCFYANNTCNDAILQVLLVDCEQARSRSAYLHPGIWSAECLFVSFTESLKIVILVDPIVTLMCSGFVFHSDVDRGVHASKRSV